MIRVVVGQQWVLMTTLAIGVQMAGDADENGGLRIPAIGPWGEYPCAVDVVDGLS